ncbi:acyl-CoA dehydrogenase family protein [Jiangella sp. DSM 45060]|uniref:acyl-CoA dehydrogenase family protein n=1 Tax=Jiangella sp. DSM 45060 TaxID=1798224 RepID=UPI0008793EC8|nr:acyl-CoA dehydrogenase family protein [Jiangella sp. DSM 45060]SDT32489.1 Acyl-CoA dehydrogenase [Jiangella sp. DSM 45060]
MDFGVIDVDDAHRALRRDVRGLVREYGTQRPGEGERPSGEGFDEPFHLALGRRGWIVPTWPAERGGAGLDRLGARILDLELARARVPMTTLGITRLVLPAVERHASPAVRDELLAGVARGSVRFCLGYTEPEGGSDVAAARTRATRDGGEWIVSGTKIFTTGAQDSQYCFLLTRTDPTRPKHRGLTMFLLPLDAPGVDIQPVRTLSGGRTTIVHYDDVRVPDAYRLGEVNDGWAVLRGPLDAEHDLGPGAGDGLDDPSMGAVFARRLHLALTAAAAWAAAPGPDGVRPADDPLVAHRLGRVAVQLAAALATPGPAGRVKGAEATVDGVAELVDLLGPAGLLHADAAGDGHAEQVHRYAQGTTTYLGTVEVFRGLIAQQDLGLPRPWYPGPR